MDGSVDGLAWRCKSWRQMVLNILQRRERIAVLCELGVYSFRVAVDGMGDVGREVALDEWRGCMQQQHEPVDKSRCLTRHFTHEVAWNRLLDPVFEVLELWHGAHAVQARRCNTTARSRWMVGVERMART